MILFHASFVLSTVASFFSEGINCSNNIYESFVRKVPQLKARITSRGEVSKVEGVQVSRSKIIRNSGDTILISGFFTEIEDMYCIIN